MSKTNEIILFFNNFSIVPMTAMYDTYKI